MHGAIIHYDTLYIIHVIHIEYKGRDHEMRAFDITLTHVCLYNTSLYMTAKYIPF